MYELILCDMGGVLVDVESDRLLHWMSQSMGRSLEEVERAVYHPELLLPFELGQITPRDYYTGLKKALELSWTYEQFVSMWNGVLKENSEVLPLIERLRKRHKLIALSNTNTLHLEYMRTSLPTLSLLHDWIASCEVGLRKPDPAIYALAVARGGARPSTTIYIDDRPELVEAGRRAGLMAIRFENGQQLEQDLRAIGINV